MTESQVSPYFEVLIKNRWRILSLMDRNPISPTRGSFSRQHWAWKFNDFPFPRLQEGSLVLAYLYKNFHSQNDFYQSKIICEYLVWSFEYWMELQNKSGCFDEAYPNEQSLAATAFTVFYVGRAVQLCKDDLSSELYEKLQLSISKACNWLCANDEYHGFLSNHLAVAACALQVGYEMTSEKKFQARSQYFIKKIISNQSYEGWYLEYEGADCGYGTHGLYYMSYLWERTKDKTLLDSCLKFVDFISYSIHPDYSLGGVYGSRNTEFVYPAGFEILKNESPMAGRISDYFRQACFEQRLCSAETMDIFNLFPLMNNYVLTLLEAKNNVVSSNVKLPFEELNLNKYFSESGLWFIANSDYYAVVGLSKGGVIQLFDKNTKSCIAQHAGFVINSSRRILSSQDYMARPQVKWLEHGRALEISVSWRSVKFKYFYTKLFLIFRLVNISIGRSTLFSRYLKNLLVKILIRKTSKNLISHIRRIHWRDSYFEIEDHISGNLRGLLKELSYFTSIHMGSSSYVDSRTASLNNISNEFIFEKEINISGKIDKNGTSWKIN